VRWRRNLGWDCILRRRREHGTKWFLCTYIQISSNMSEHQRSLLKPAIHHHTPPASSFSTYIPTPSSSDHQHSQTTNAPHKTIRNTHRHPPTTRPSIIVLATGNYPTAKKIRKPKPRPKLRKDSAPESRSIVFTVRSPNWGIDRALLNWKLRERCVDESFSSGGLF